MKAIHAALLLSLLGAAPAAASSQPPDWQAHACRLPKRLSADEQAGVLQSITLDDRAEYFAMSEVPITEDAEQRMESVSSVVTKEHYNEHWSAGEYSCARCGHKLYSSEHKFRGPCMWPSFRLPLTATSLHARRVPDGSYNEYACEVHELYCGHCNLFLGHQFADGRECGDSHELAGQRHCVLSLSLRFEAEAQ